MSSRENYVLFAGIFASIGAICAYYLISGISECREYLGFDGMIFPLILLVSITFFCFIAALAFFIDWWRYRKGK